MTDPSCPLCENSKPRLHYSLQNKRVFWCHLCHLFFIDPLPDPLRLRTYYEGTASEFEATYFESFQNHRFRSFAKGLDLLSKWNRRGRLLDVGTGLGFFLKQAHEASWEVEGLELSGKVAAYAKQTLGVPVHVGTLEDVPLEANQYQAVTLWDAIEHLPDPKSTLLRIRDLLAPQGVVVIRTPVCDSLIPWVLGFFYRVSLGRIRSGFERLFKEHLFHFSEEGIRQLVERCGFRILQVYREDYIDPQALAHKEWTRNPLVRLGASWILGASRLLRQQDEIVMYAEATPVAA